MRGFEKDKWELRNYNEFKYVQHKDFPFINFDLRKIQRGFDYRPPVWKVELRKWGKEPRKTVTFNVSYKRLTRDRLPEIFEHMIRVQDAKLIIFKYLFEGRY
ncbi:MAG: hypothetical protein ACOC1O_04215 [bacterium]